MMIIQFYLGFEIWDWMNYIHNIIRERDFIKYRQFFLLY